MLQTRIAIRVCQFAHVARILEMFQYLLRIAHATDLAEWLTYNSIMPEIAPPQRIVSLQPSVTVTLRDLGLLHSLAACTRYCLEVCPELRNTETLIIEDSWSAKMEQIISARPDLVIASVPYRIESLAEILKAGVPCLCLAPHSLNDVYTDILHIARTLGVESAGQTIVKRMRKEIDAFRSTTSPLSRSGQSPPLVYCEEWGKPLILSQGWVAELVEAAGGKFFGEPGKQVTEEEVVAANPDVIIAAWCGAGNRVPLEKLATRKGWNQTSAVRNGRVYCINDEFLNTPASTLIDGLKALAAAINPLILNTLGLRQIAAVTDAPVRIK
jgi:iron complex transport system substrate-binding protein